jgi:hypothetical protein
LSIGQTYCVEFYISLADFTQYSSDKIGALFTNNQISVGNDQPLNFTPQIELQTFVTDKTNWVKVSGIVQPTIALNYLTIGNFNNDAATSTSVNPGGGTCVSCYGAYYYIDDVSVTSCSTFLKENKDDFQLHFFPNPFSGKLFFETNNTELKTLCLFDITMNKILTKEFEKETELVTSELSSGIYFYQIKTKSGSFKQGKLIKE